jgi:hypothetical protein
MPATAVNSVTKAPMAPTASTAPATQAHFSPNRSRISSPVAPGEDTEANSQFLYHVEKGNKQEQR